MVTPPRAHPPRAWAKLVGSGDLYCIVLYRTYIVSVLGRDEGYKIKFSPLPEGTPEGKGLYLTVYPELSPNTDIISF